MPCHSVISIVSLFLGVFWQPLNISKFKVSKRHKISLNCILIVLDILDKIIFYLPSGKKIFFNRRWTRMDADG